MSRGWLSRWTHSLFLGLISSLLRALHPSGLYQLSPPSVRGTGRSQLALAPRPSLVGRVEKSPRRRQAVSINRWAWLTAKVKRLILPCTRKRKPLRDLSFLIDSRLNTPGRGLIIQLLKRNNQLDSLCSSTGALYVTHRHDMHSTR